MAKHLRKLKSSEQFWNRTDWKKLN